MRISTRISLTISIITSSILIIFGITIYLFSLEHQTFEFQERLKERVVITEKMFLEKDSFQPDELEKISNKFLQKLPKETEEVFPINKDQHYTFLHDFPEKVKATILGSVVYSFKIGKLQGESRKFNVKGKDYLIIVTAEDQVGLENLKFLRGMIIFLFSIGIPLIFVSSFIMTKRSLLPINKKINRANSMSATNFDQRLIVHNPNDELGKMAIAFNKLLDRLQNSYEAQKSFIRNASHEIRNPLTTIMGEAEITNSKPRTTEEYQKSLDTILMEAETLNSTVSNLLQLSKVAGNEGNIEFKQVSFNHLLKEIKSSYDFMNPDNQIVINIRNSGNNNDFAIMGNNNLLKAAILNLLDNACKFSFNKEVEVTLEKDKNWIILTIKDQGVGINSEEIGKVLTPFYRGNNVIKIKGSGIGLSLSSKIIDIHQGRLEIKSQIDQGTEVKVIIPHVLP